MSEKNINEDQVEGSSDASDEAIPEGVVRRGDGTSVVTLLRPVEFGGTTYDAIVVREPTGNDLIKSDRAKGDVERGLMMLAAISGLSIGVIRAMRSRDIERAMQEVEHLKNV